MYYFCRFVTAAPIFYLFVPYYGVSSFNFTAVMALWPRQSFKTLDSLFLKSLLWFFVVFFPNLNYLYYRFIFFYEVGVFSALFVEMQPYFVTTNECGSYLFRLQSSRIRMPCVHCAAIPPCMSS
ncbi:hypothetical protein, unlikely [Trypanosoma brucei gambiense DAL972]|uniref:Uncharacterized protein n=1 Tax=Trypanosoma brucei gambiense (strain MHOM/CI/86/DAL972) TaxID=679716 RepID=C9ZTJ9_TRYB9|nr:hypothetical protein, unlikely [Trypanosoma brucei gambiense DAL972]CBH12734.1 hypothetical protein, unlikely [Trypanosoma brucei gambiense DAL972]|eukprot:XP_011775014.1 hypothetical protein, unlikely [Trypanosoma brucei gambiense DAL972]